MEMMNRLLANALDSKSFVDKLLAEDERTIVNEAKHVSYGVESRTQRRARERAEAKAARKGVSHGQR